MPKKYEPPDPRRSHTIMTQEEANSGKPTKWTALELFGGIRHLSLSLFNLHYLTALHVSKNCLTKLPPELARLHNLTFLDLSHNLIDELPKEMGDLTSLRELNLASNKLRILPYELGRLFLLQRLSLEGNPLSPEFAGHIKDPNGTVKLLNFLLDHLKVSGHPPPREWVSVPRAENSSFTLSGEVFTVMSYNILCDKYATRQVCGYCPSWALAWSYRRELVFKEIQAYNADIVSLQEVETEHYHNLFLPTMRSFGYDGIFNSKSRARTMMENERKSVDGCAIFFRTSRFRLIRDYLVEFNQLAAMHSEGADDMLNRVMTKDNIGIVAALELKGMTTGNRYYSAPPTIVVANAHVHWDPEYCDVKLIQTIMMINELETVVESIGQERKLSPALAPAQQIPLILCGDLNSLPESGVVEYLTKGRVSTEHADFLSNAYEGFLSRHSGPMTSPDRIRGGVAPGTSSISHNLRLARSYDGPRTLPFTNKTYDFTGVIDYIMHTRGLVEVQKVLGMFPLEWLDDNKVIGFPHPHFASDHIPLVVHCQLAAPNV